MTVVSSTAPSLAAGAWGRSYAYAPSPRELLTPTRRSIPAFQESTTVAGPGRGRAAVRPEGATWMTTAAAEEEDEAAAAGGLCCRCCPGTGGTRRRACRSRQPARPSFAPTSDGAAGAPGPGGWGRALRRQRASMGDRVFWSVLKSLVDLPTRRGEALDGSGTFLEESDTSNEIQALARERTAEKFWATSPENRPIPGSRFVF